MSTQTAAPSKPLRFVDPAEFTPHFAWHTAKDGQGEQVFCEDVPLADVA